MQFTKIHGEYIGGSPAKVEAVRGRQVRSGLANADVFCNATSKTPQPKGTSECIDILLKYIVTRKPAFGDNRPVGAQTSRLSYRSFLMP